MELAIKTNAFTDMTIDDLMIVDGGTGVKQGLCYTAGAVCLAWSPIVGVVVGYVATPVAGVGAACGVASLGCQFISLGNKYK